MSTATATVTEVHMPVTDTFLPSAGTDNKEFTVTTETETVIQSSGIPGYFPTTVTANGPASTQPPETEHTNTPWPQSTTSTSPTDISSSSSQSSITTHQTPNRETLTTENESTNSPTLLTDKLVPESSLSSHLTSGSVSVEMLTTTTKVHHSTSTSASNTPPSSASASATPTPSSSSTPQSTPTSSLHTTTKSIATVLTENKTLIVPGTEHTTDHTITTPVSAMPLSYEASQSTSPEPNITTSSHLTTVSNSSLPLSATTATTIPTTKSVTSPSILNTSGIHSSSRYRPFNYSIKHNPNYNTIVYNQNSFSAHNIYTYPNSSPGSSNRRQHCTLHRCSIICNDNHAISIHVTADIKHDIFRVQHTHIYHPNKNYQYPITTNNIPRCCSHVRLF
ncbi:cell wall protein DAN4-like [Alosa alosa]|uniref:cell wall protein DAN4-like n=1 Tax=Alosa alosa TaxID=278164 RepID=UPI0020155254|nr:cell wall protein DAN4-like [Alosa alosa]